MKLPITERITELIYPAHCPLCARILYTRGEQIYACPECKAKLVYVKEPFCTRCGKPVRTGQILCGDCRKGSHYFLQGRSVFAYQGTIKESLIRFKYENKKEYARFYADEFCKKLGDWAVQMRIGRIIPVPLHPAKRRQRGYNQSELVAKRIGEALGIPVDTETICRRVYSSAQKDFGREMRLARMHHVFGAKGRLPREEGVLIFDDIYTTGATMDAAAIAVLAAGSRRVFAGSIAIGLGENALP